MSHLSVQTKPDSLFKPVLLRSKTSASSGASIDEQMYLSFYSFEIRLYSDIFYLFSPELII
jgi:hypothetical protein